MTEKLVPQNESEIFILKGFEMLMGDILDMLKASPIDERQLNAMIATTKKKSYNMAGMFFKHLALKEDK
jgi:hypothetical protein